MDLSYESEETTQHGCSQRKNKQIEDIESFLYDKLDSFKDNDFVKEKDIQKIRNIVIELVKMDFTDEIKYKLAKIDFTNPYLYADFVYILTLFFGVFYTLFNFKMIYEQIEKNILSFSLYFIIGLPIFKAIYSIFIFAICDFFEFVKYEKIETTGKDKFNKAILVLRRKFGIQPKKSQMNYFYLQLRNEKKIERNELLEKCLIAKSMRSESGVIVNSVIMPPDNFSCAFDCYYCPNVEGYSRSYYPGEPTVERGARNGFSGFKQFRERGHVYLFNGHPVDKFEVIVLGGTFSSYQPKIAENFICDLYYAANTMMDNLDTIRPRKSLDEEIKMNEDALCKIIGLTIETRPDMITKYELRRFRRYGVTRVQLGVQHTDDEILDKLNRQCNQEKIIDAIELLKCEGFKFDLHIMPDLPNSTIEKDKKMLTTMLTDWRYRGHGLKIYPHNVMKETEVYKWYEKGTYKPYAESNPEGFVDLMVWTMKNIPPYIRVNRVQRDFPGNAILGGNKCTNLRQVIDDRLKEDNFQSKDIRSMEIRQNKFDPDNVRIIRYDLPTKNGIEVFLGLYSCTCTVFGKSCCIPNMIHKMKNDYYQKMFNTDLSFYGGCGKENRIHGFLRLHMTKDAGKEAFPVLKNKGLILEFHVYGKVQSTYSSREKSKSQHKGFGTILIEHAENIVKQEGHRYNGLNGMAVIAGVGVRNYYRKKGYEIPYEETYHGDFLIKNFSKELTKKID
jgi:elongator complex protein 3